jgi:hypothetical protein
VTPAVAAGLAAIVVAHSAPALAESLREVVAGLGLEWAPLTGDLAILAGDRARLSTRLGQALAARVRVTSSRAEQLGLAFVALTELAYALGDGVRARAQAELAAAPATAQAAALDRERAGSAADARDIAAAADALLDESAQLLA